MIRDRCTGMEGRYVTWRNLYLKQRGGGRLFKWRVIKCLGRESRLKLYNKDVGVYTAATSFNRIITIINVINRKTGKPYSKR